MNSLFTATVLGLAMSEPTASEWLEKADAAASEHDSRRSVEFATKAIAADGKLATAWYLRGREHFRLGKIRESVADFDRYVELAPDRASRQWERGIALYYAGQYKRGAEQFELYQTYHDNDVENSVWRFLCMVPDVGVKKARAVMLPIRNDRRVPMMQVFDLYRGKIEPADVLKTATADDPPQAVLAGRLFYANLYLGLYYEVLGEEKLARQYILLAADKKNATARVNRYMWDVARIHAERLTADDGK